MAVKSKTKIVCVSHEEDADGRSVADLVIERDKGLTAIIQTINDLNIKTSEKDTNNEGSD